MRKSTKLLLSVILVLALLVAAMIAVPYYLLDINIFDRSGWATSESGEIQYHDFYGEPLKQWQFLEGDWYYFSPEDGDMVTGWLELEEGRYYLSSDGTRQVGWLELSDGTYYLKPSNAISVTGWLELEGETYYLDSQGKLCFGWQNIDGKRYRFNEAGEMLTGWLEVEGNRYYLDSEGVMVTGWVDTENGRCYLGSDGALCSGWTDTEDGRFYLTQEGTVATGWLETEEGIYYLDEQGQIVTGWIVQEEKTYYLTEEGQLAKGWQELDGERYYFREDGTMARGKVVIDGTAFYFASTGKHTEMVNRWNPVPKDYQVDLVEYNGYQIAREARDPLVQMIEQIQSLGYYKVTSIYRSVSRQQAIWDDRYNSFVAAGYTREGALAEVAKHVADPGTSEHHLGLAVDIDGVPAVHGWLAEHSWEYGFIVRYPDGKTEITGIVYEPWHYRYVGKELAKEIYESGLTMEEYMDKLTEAEGSDAGTASNPEK